MKKPKNKLPQIPSKLIRLAIRDLKKVERLKTRKINMHIWHESRVIDGKPFCVVCLAGSVMDRTLKIDPKINMREGQGLISSADLRALGALNNLRSGYVEGAFLSLGIKEISSYPKDVAIARYDFSKTLFKLDMLKLADSLEAIGY